MATDRRLFFSAQQHPARLDARTGKPIASFGTTAPWTSERASTAIPRRSSSRADFRGRCSRTSSSSARRRIANTRRRPATSARVDVRTGAVVWTFRTVPRAGEFGADTWPANARDNVGGANDWAELSIDPARGIVYVPTGSAKYNFYGGYRHGNNLFANCIIALDARTGRRLWHFQTVHHDIWDVDNNSAPQLTTIRHDGRQIEVVAGRVEDRLSLRRSIESRAHQSGRSSSGPCRRARPCQARSCRRRSRSRRIRRRSCGSRSPRTTQSVHPDDAGARAVPARVSLARETRARSRRSVSKRPSTCPATRAGRTGAARPATRRAGACTSSASTCRPSSGC